MSDKIALVVIGAHRSGTSAMARVLSLAGAALPVNLMPPWRGNETGFWEPQRVADFNDIVLAAYDATWDSPFGLGSSTRRRETLARFVDGARALVRDEYREAPLIVLKEPRISLIADLWTAALEAEGYRCKFVIMVRNPLEVASSLRKRDGMSIDHGLLLWGAYQASSELLTRNHDRVFCQYDDILGRPASVLDHVEAKLRIELPRRTPQAHAEMDAFIRPDHKHNVASALVTIPEHLSPIREMADFLSGAIAGEAPNADTAGALQDWFANLDQTITPLILKVRTERDAAIATAHEQQAHYLGETARLTEQQTAQRGEIERLVAHIAQIDAARIDAERRFATADQNLDQTQRDLTSRDEVMNELRQMLEAANASIGELSVAINAQASDVETMRVALAQRDEALAAAQVAHAQQVTHLGETAEHAAAALRGALDAAHDEIARIGSQADAREAVHANALDEARSELARVTADRDALSAEVARLTLERAGMEEDAATLRAALDDAAGQVARLSADVGGLRDEQEARTAAATAEAARVAAVVDEYERRIAALDVVTAAGEQERDGLRADLARLEAERYAQAQDAADAVARLASVTEQHDALIEGMRAENDAITRERDELRGAVDRLSVEAAAAHQGHAEREQALAVELAQAREAAMRARAEHEGAAARFGANRDQDHATIAALTDEFAQLRATLDATVAQLNEDLARSQASLDAAETAHEAYVADHPDRWFDAMARKRRSRSAHV